MNAGLNSILLSTKEKDSSAVFEIAFSYGLYQMTWDELHKALLSRSSDGLIGKDGFASFFQDRSDGQDEWSTTRSELEGRVMGIFDCFDRTGSDFCDVDELTCGLSLFIRGTKSNKLLSAFNLLDEDSDGYLTRRGTWRFFRSFLSALVAISSAFAGNGRPELNTLLDDVSVQVTSEVLGGGTSKVSFDLISDWYSSTGFLESTWVELLDLKKWAVTTTDKEAGSDGYPEDSVEDEEEGDDYDDDDDDNYEDEENSEEELERESAEFLRKEGLMTLKIASDHAMSITVDDTKRVFSLSIASGLRLLDASQLEHLILPYASGDGRIGPAGFLNFLQSVMPQSTAVSDSQRDTVLQHLFSIYYAFEQSAVTFGEASGKVDVFSLAAGLTVLCLGSKSSKLGVGFGLFADEDEDGALSPNAVAGLMASYLLTLQALDVLPEGNLAVDTASHVARIMAESIEGPVNFISFGKWYNLQGCHCAPWIELLNLEKWVKITGTEGVPTRYPDDTISETYDYNPYQRLGDDEEEEEEEEEKDGDEEEAEWPSASAAGEQFSIVFNCASFERRINVNYHTARCVNKYTKGLLSGIDQFGAMCAAIDSESESGLIRMDKFEHLLRALDVPVDLSLHPHSAEGDSFIMTVFDYFDRGNVGEVDVSELIIALACLLHKGSKSEKLAFAFDLLDIEGSGSLGRWNTWRFFRCFITTIILMAAPQVSGKKRFIQILADESATWVTQCVFEHKTAKAGMSEEDDDDDEEEDMRGETVAFDDIAEWYSSSGCEDSSWIELLNVSKWITLTTTMTESRG